MKEKEFLSNTDLSKMVWGRYYNDTENPDKELEKNSLDKKIIQGRNERKTEAFENIAENIGELNEVLRQKNAFIEFFEYLVTKSTDLESAREQRNDARHKLEYADKKIRRLERKVKIIRRENFKLKTPLKG
jgi:phage-related tail protein